MPLTWNPHWGIEFDKLCLNNETRLPPMHVNLFYKQAYNVVKISSNIRYVYECSVMSNAILIFYIFNIWVTKPGCLRQK